MNLAHWLWRTAQRQADKQALFRGTQCVATYAEFAQQSGAIAASLSAHYGVKPGDRVLLAAQNHPAWAITFFGILKAGATVVPLDPNIDASSA